MNPRNVYLEQVAWEEALEILKDNLKRCGFFSNVKKEIIPIESSCGRVTTKAVYGKISSPHYRAAAMDGIAVDSSDTFGASETNPIFLKMGRDAIEVDTGDLLPDNKDAVIKIEDINLTENGNAEIISAAIPWQNVRPIGEDIVATEMILPSNHQINPYDIGAMLAGGLTEIEVYSLPRVGILPTGTELIQPGEPLKPGSIIESNSKVLAAMVKEWGAVPEILSITKDDYKELRETITNALKRCDILLINAGSSAGREDYTASLVQELGELLVHGVSIKPGKPVVLGIVDKKPVIGIPGFPVSATITNELFVKPLIYHYLKVPEPQKKTVKCILARGIYSSLGVEEFVRVNVAKIGEKMVATPLGRGAGVIMSLVKAQGILRVPRFEEGFEAGEEVTIELLESKAELDTTLLFMGSHDLSINILNDWMHKLFKGTELVPAHVGSLGGILSLKKGEAHLAGIHLLDPETGEYNVSYLKKYLPEKKVWLVNLVYREQGLLVGRGNPKSIKTLEDLTRSDVYYINRQRGAGTRVLLDFLLKEKGIKASNIKGYEREEYTHLNVGIAVSSGSATCGMGIKTAADALNLDFIPIAKERYDLCIPEEFIETDLIKKLLYIINNPDFKNELSRMGYDTSATGEVIKID